MAGERILIVDDDEALLEMVEYNVSKEGYSVTCVTSGERALVEARKTMPDLIVLDVMLPSIGGLEVLQSLKSDAKTKNIPVVMLTAKSQESDIVTGLQLGADDYITKPFSVRVLMARIRAVLRRRLADPGEASQPSPLQVGEIVVDPDRHDVSVAGERILLSEAEFRLFSFLAAKPGWTFTRKQIVNGIRGESDPVTERSVDVQVASLRRKLGDLGSSIETVRGVGYRFKKS